MTANYLITGDDGMPIAAADMDKIQAAATVFAYRMAEACRDPKQMDEVAVRTIVQEGVEGFGYVAAAALRILAEHILAPCLDVSKELGADLMPGLIRASHEAQATLTQKEN